MRFVNAVRLGGLAALLAGVLLVISELLSFLPSGLLPFELSGNELAIYGWLGISGYLGVLLAVLVQLGLVGLYAPYASQAGVLGAIGFLVAFIGSRLAIVPSFTDPIIDPSLLLSGGASEGFVGPLVRFALLSFVLGWGLFGFAALVAGIYPQSAAALLIAGALILLLPLPLSGIVFAVAIAWMGYVLFVRRGREASQLRRES
jgi:hypothetical protein